MTGERVHPSKLPGLIQQEAEHLYVCIQAAENHTYRLSEMLDWQAAGGDAEARPKRTRARRLHRRLFALLEPAEDVYHENEGHLAPDSGSMVIDDGT